MEIKKYCALCDAYQRMNNIANLITETQHIFHLLAATANE